MQRKSTGSLEFTLKSSRSSTMKAKTKKKNKKSHNMKGDEAERGFSRGCGEDEGSKRRIHFI